MKIPKVGLDGSPATSASLKVYRANDATGPTNTNVPDLSVRYAWQGIADAFPHPQTLTPRDLHRLPAGVLTPGRPSPTVHRGT